LKRIILKYLKATIFVLSFIYCNKTTELWSQYTFDWSSTYGGDAWDEAFGMVEDSHGNLVLCGYTKAQEKHMWIIKIDDRGKSIWGKTFKATPVSEGKDIIITKDSNIVAAGYSVKPFTFQSDFWLLKLNREGEKLWDQNYGTDNDESAKAIDQTSDGGFVMAGVRYTGSTYLEDALIIKVDSTGKKVWERTYGNKGVDYANDVIETSDKGIVVSGMQSSRDGNYNSFWVVKLDSAGNDIWDYTYKIDKWDEATALVEGIDGYIYVTGFTRTFSVIDYDVVLIKLDQQGQQVWQKVISWGRWDNAMSICATFDNGIVVSGNTRSGEVNSSDFATTKFDENGNVIWENIFVRNSLEYSNRVIETRDNGLAIAGTTYAQGRGWDFALLKFRNNDLPEINFYQDSVSTSINEDYLLKSCITTKSNLKNIQLFFNDSLTIDQFKREGTTVTQGCDIPLNTQLKLTKGLNNIELVLTDYKNHQTRKTCKVYFIPPSEENW
jgi:hypothetical protein